MKKSLTALLMAIILNSASFAQTVGLGADFASKYIWRGLIINNAANVQPSLTFNSSGFSAGFWGSYSTGNLAFSTDELDIFASYTFSGEAGDFGLLITDYYFPNAGLRMGDFTDGGGAHTLEAALTYSGPISILAAVNFYNDPGNNIYLELGYSTELENVALDFAVGATPGSKTNPIYYGTESFSVINLMVKASKSLKLSDSFELPLFTGFVLNPQAEYSHLIAGFSLSL